MKNRCLNKANRAYKNYGGRGISVSPKWMEFSQFKNDMGGLYSQAINDYPKQRITLERIDNEKGYSKKNCKWIPFSEQSKNTRRCVFVEYKGENKTISDWARLYGLKPETLRTRLKKYKWPIEKALTGRNYQYRGKKI